MFIMKSRDADSISSISALREVGNQIYTSYIPKEFSLVKFEVKRIKTEKFELSVSTDELMSDCYE